MSDHRLWEEQVRKPYLYKQAAKQRVFLAVGPEPVTLYQLGITLVKVVKGDGHPIR